jgi:hypothetical protein
LALDVGVVLVLVLVAAFPAAAAADEESVMAERPSSLLPPSRSGGGVALTGSYGVVNGHHAQVFRSLELQTSFAPVGKTFFGVVAGLGEGIATPVASTYAEARAHTHYDHAYWDLWFGPQVAWGAPYRAGSRWGASLEAGVSAGLRDVKLYSAFGNDDPARYVSPFGAAALRLALCRCETVRAFVGASGRWVVAHFGDSVQSASIDLGLALAP